MRKLLMLLAVCALAAPASAQVQYCPAYINGTGTDCSAQYNSCWGDNEGKNCDASTCSAYCEQQYRDCMYGPVVSTNVTYPISALSDRKCVIGCSAEPWVCDITLPDDPYGEYDTQYWEIHTEHHRCDDGYEYDDSYGYFHDRTCYQYDRQCLDVLGPPNTWPHYTLVHGACFIDETKTYVRDTPY